MRCSKCGREAVYFARYEGRYYCHRHFNEMVERKVKATIRKYQMIRRGEKIGVAVSGGKDSVVLMHLLAKLRRKFPFELVAITIDEGIRGYRDRSVEIAKRNAELLGIEHHIYSFRDYIGLTLDETVEIMGPREERVGACSYCGVWRRWLLNCAARELGVDKLAVGLNLDDEVQMFLMNLMRGDVARLGRTGPYYEEIHEGLVPRIKPLREVPEKEIVLYAVLNDIEVDLSECPYAVEAFRAEIRDWLNEMEEKHPGTKYQLLRSYDRLFPLIAKTYAREIGLNRCKLCGQPTAGKICKACQFRLQVVERARKKGIAFTLQGEP
ncbi:TIGR00269 family protein [Pyrococcus yayanosii]|uniref:N-type ATP pyrophosphatase superfamily protein n=1 Tax=Pyrococcus yayanosii (strain CH1 / JCM 16557) TaxID=529709 RepID=F8AHT2_PYRYC|nr:TIGR00269 family protein [Pyrococcus yayanosii]AEH24215.1 n-type ATP pyrophosphatase superfamily protein [Pyrococcus yayanosii CH1]